MLMHTVTRWNDVIPIAIAEMAAVMMHDIVMVSMMNNIVVAMAIELGICRRGDEHRTTACESAKNLKS